MKKISSVQNAIIKSLVKLHSNKGRKDQQCFIAEGLRTIQTIMQELPAVQLYTIDSLANQAVELTGDEETVTIVTSEVMQKISQSSTPSGILGIFEIPSQREFYELSSGIVLYELADPGNVGTLIRTTAAMNKNTVVCIGGVDPWSFKVVQSSAGTIVQTNIFRITWDELMEQKNGLQIAALVVQDGESPDKVNFSDMLIVVGSEAHGIPDESVRQCDAQITLPMPGNTESLNAAVAGSIALYLAWQTQK